jgi:hypothetical protein
MAYTSTRLRFIFASNPTELCQLIESLPNKVEIKNVALGQDKRWYAWFTITDLDSNGYTGSKKTKVKGD